MSGPVKVHVWMQTIDSGVMYHVGTITYEKEELTDGGLTIDGFAESVIDLVNEINQVSAGMKDEDD